MKGNLKACLMIISPATRSKHPLQVFLNTTSHFFSLVLSPGLALGKSAKHISIPLHFGSVFMCNYLLLIMMGKKFYIFAQSFKIFQLFHLGYFS